MPGMSASVSSSILVMETRSPTLSSVTFAPVWMRVGVRPARESCAVSAIVKHPAWAAPISSSGLVAAWPSSNRDLNEYGPSKAPLPTLSRPLPSARLPFHSASAFRVGMEPPFALPSFSVSLFDALLDLLGRVPAINREYLAGDERCAVGTEPDDGARDLFRPAIRPIRCGGSHNFLILGVGAESRNIPLAIAPGSTALTRTFWLAYSCATVLVNHV